MTSRGSPSASARRVWTRITLRTAGEFLLALAAIVVLVVIAKDVVEHEADAFDASLARAIRDLLRSRAADLIFGGITYLGSEPALIAVTGAMAVVAWSMRHRRVAVIVVVNGLVAYAVMTLLKHLVARSRPTLDPAIPVPASYSFPSGHAVGSLAVYATVTAAIIRITSRRLRLPVVTLATFLILAIGLSRVYLGVHWPLDVVAGYAAAIPLAAVSIHLMRRLEVGTTA